MKIPITEESIGVLKQSEGSLEVSLSELQQIIKYLEEDSCKLILLNGMCFVVFTEVINIEFRVLDYKSEEDLKFLTNRRNKKINASKKDGTYMKFIVDEFLQGNSFLKRIKRLANILVPLVALNALGFLYANQLGIKDVFTGLLAAVSIFVAIFSLFITSHDYMTRRRLSLFENGQLSYYFSVDKYVTQTGIYAIILSVLALVVSSGFTKSEKLYALNTENIIVIVLLNLTFTGVYIILRSMVEFYIIRPGKFILGDLKTESFKSFRKRATKDS